ncbi:hypothetical protein OROHE_004372 [Orobanche hederae]
MDSSSRKSSSNKITDIVRLQQILKKWKKLATNHKNNTTTTSNSRSINKFLKRTLSFSEKEMTSSSSSSSSSINNNVPRGYIAVCVGKELKRFVIPTEYLGHQVFGVLLAQAEEEFGFQQQGPLKFPCQVDLFEKILKMMVMENQPPLSLENQLIGFHVGDNTTIPPLSSPPQSSNHHPQMCR